MGGDDFLSVFHLLHSLHETVWHPFTQQPAVVTYYWKISKKKEEHNTEEKAIYSVKYLGSE